MYIFQNVTELYIQVWIDMRWDTDNKTIGDLIPELKPTDKFSRQKLNKEAVILNDTTGQLELHNHRTLCPNKIAFYSSAHGMPSM